MTLVLDEVPAQVRARPQRRGRIARGVRRSLPMAVWLLAVAVAIHFMEHRETVSKVIGFAEVDAVTVAHLEPGVVRSVHVDLHSHVEQGQMLVEMDDRSERLRLAAMQIDVERLRAEIDAERVRTSADNARASARAVGIERQFLRDREAAHVDYLSQLVADAADRAALRGATVELEFVRKLYEGNNETYRALNEAETEVATLSAKVEGNKELLARERSRLEDADRRWFEFSQRAGATMDYDPVLMPLRLAVDEREQEVRELMHRLELQVLRAPVAGQVTGIFSHPGDRVQAGNPLLVISPTQTPHVIAYLPEDRALVVQPGARVLVQRSSPVPAGPSEFHGTVTSLSSVVSETPIRYRSIPNIPSWGRAMLVTLDPDGSLLPGESSIVQVVVGQ